MGALEKWRIEHGECFKLWYGIQPTVVVASARLVQEVLADEAHYSKGYDHEFRPWLGDSILLSSGENWREKRMLLSKAFHHRTLHAHIFPVVEACTKHLLERWSGGNKGAVDLHAELAGLGLHIVGLTTCGSDFQPNGKGSAMLEHFRTILNEIERRSYHLVALPNWFYCTFTPAGRRFQHAVANLRKTVESIVQQRRSDMHIQDNAEEGDLLSLLLHAVDEDTGQARLTNREIGEELMTFLFAGHETTSTCITWTLYLLALHPDAEAEVRREIQAVCKGQTPDLEDVGKLPYLFLCIQESLRLYPPQPAFLRRAIGDTKIGGYHIPKGTEVSCVPYLLHRDPDCWENPSAFLPERFAKDSKRNTEKRQSFDYLPFSGGPRSCIGKNMALLECKVVIAMILQRFTIKLVPGQNVQPVPAVTLCPSELMVTIHTND